MIQEYTSFISVQVFGVMPIKMMIIYLHQSDSKLGMFKLNDKNDLPASASSMS